MKSLLDELVLMLTTPLETGEMILAGVLGVALAVSALAGLGWPW